MHSRTRPDPYRLAPGFHSRLLSRPQLFLEGNHRTGDDTCLDTALRLPGIADDSGPCFVTGLSRIASFPSKGWPIRRMRRR